MKFFRINIAGEDNGCKPGDFSEGSLICSNRPKDEASFSETQSDCKLKYELRGLKSAAVTIAGSQSAKEGRPMKVAATP